MDPDLKMAPEIQINEKAKEAAVRLAFPPSFLALTVHLLLINPSRCEACTFLGLLQNALEVRLQMQGKQSNLGA